MDLLLWQNPSFNVVSRKKRVSGALTISCVKLCLCYSELVIELPVSYSVFFLNGITSLCVYEQSKGVGVVNASPISMGLLSDRGPPDWHPAQQDIKDMCAKAAAFCRVSSPS